MSQIGNNLLTAADAAVDVVAAAIDVASAASAVAATTTTSYRHFSINNKMIAM